MINVEMSAADIDYDAAIARLSAEILRTYPGETVFDTENLQASVQALSSEQKCLIFCGMAERYNTCLTSLINNILSEHSLAQNIRIDNIYIDKVNSGIFAAAQNIVIDYKKILESDIVKQKLAQMSADSQSGLKRLIPTSAALSAVKAVITAAPDKSEEKLVKLINSPANRQKLINLLTALMAKNGLRIAISDINLVYGKSKNKAASRKYYPAAYEIIGGNNL